VLGVGRIVVVRGDCPAGLALHIDLGHLERMHRPSVFVELGRYRGWSSQGVEVGKQRFAAEVFRRGVAQVGRLTTIAASVIAAATPRKSGFFRFVHGSC